MSSAANQSQPFRLPPLYPLLGSTSGSAGSALEHARDCLEAGVRILQFRKKPPSGGGQAERSAWERRRRTEALQLAGLCARHQGLFIINDHARWVLPCQAHGLHLGQGDLDPRQARRMLGGKAVIGFSTHDEEQFERAQDLPIDYVALGPIFRSPTKPEGHPAVGLQRLRRLAAASRLPVVAIGGITLQRAPQVWKAGAASVAVISDIFNRPDPASRVRAFLQAHAGLGQP